MPSLSSTETVVDATAPADASARAATVVLAAGGTGGHVIPGIAVARELRRRGHETIFLGTPRGMESRLVPEAGFPLRQLRVGALNNVSAIRRLRTLAQLPLSVLHAYRALRDERPAVAVSLGGYAAGPLLLAARLRGLPIVIIEPNAIPGLAHRLVRKWVRKALVAFPAAARFFPRGRTRVTGVPVRAEFHSLADGRSDGRFGVLITGGSQGASRLNSAALVAVQLWCERGESAAIRLVHQTGVREHKEIQTRYAELGLDAKAVPFVDDMPAAYSAADVIVCRAGASTIAELTAAGKVSILVPYPHAADQHQLRNAEALVKEDAARLIEDAQLSGDRLVAEIDALRNDPAARTQIEKRARSLSRPRAAAEIADEILAAAELGDQ